MKCIKVFERKNTFLRLLGTTSLLVSLIVWHIHATAKTGAVPMAGIQQHQVTGIVTLRNGAPVSGANILVKETNQLYKADEAGKFSFRVSPKATLVFSSLGLKSEEIEVRGRSSITVFMDEDYQELEEVVVLGYGTVEKSDMTGSVTSVKLNDVNETKAVSVTEALQGKVAGVNIVTNSGEPGGAITFNVRGMTSVTGSNQPLVVIDGQPIESSFSTTYAGSDVEGGANFAPADPLAGLNPNDIESIEILKDASATAIYGSRGANGVVMITTKSGRGERDQVVYSNRFDLSQLPKKLEVLNSYEYMTMRNEASVNSGGTPIFSQTRFDEIHLEPNTNWQDEVYRNAVGQDHQMSFSGQDEKSNYLLSGNYSDQQSIIKNAGFRRGGVRLNYTRDISSKLKVALRTSLSLSERKFAQQSNWTGILGLSTVMGSLAFNPLDIPYDEDTGDVNEELTNNPLLLINKATDRTVISTILSNFTADYKLNKYLTYTLKAGINQVGSVRSVYYPTGTYIGDQAPGGSATIADRTNSNYLVDNLLTFRRTYAKKHRINAVGGFSYQHWFRTGSGVTGLGFPSNTLSYYAMSLASYPGRYLYTPSPERKLQSVLGRVNYAYDRRYLLTLTGRYDGSSRLAPGNRWAMYPSVGLGWNASNEQFFKQHVKFISTLKMRASIGVAGNDNIGLGASQASYGRNDYPFGQNINPTFIVDNFENPDLKWERTTKYNAGLDFGFLKNKLDLTVDYYNHVTTDLLIDLALPGSTGHGSYPTNVGKIKNYGLDIESSYKAKVGQVNLDLGANFSTFNNKVIHMGESPVIYGRTFFSAGALALNQPVTAAFAGERVSNFFGYKTDGIYQNQAEIDNDPGLASDSRTDIQPGMVRYVDVNGDGRITGEDRTIIGSPIPDFTYGFNASVTWKKFSASTTIFGSYGGQLLNLNRWMIGSNHANTSWNSLSDAYYGRWHGEGTSNMYPKLTTNSIRLQSRFPDWMVEDASFVRLQNLTLGYNFSLPRRLKGGNVKLFVTGTNLLTLTKYSGYDPHVNSFGQNSLNNGIDLGTLPQARSYSAGITLSY